jgi:hypothetical protein
LRDEPLLFLGRADGVSPGAVLYWLAKKGPASWDRAGPLGNNSDAYPRLTTLGHGVKKKPGSIRPGFFLLPYI